MEAGGIGRVWLVIVHNNDSAAVVMTVASSGHSIVWRDVCIAVLTVPVTLNLSNCYLII